MSGRVRGDSGAFDTLPVEADPEAVTPFVDSFKTTDRTNGVTDVADADEALDYVHQRGSNRTCLDPPWFSSISTLREVMAEPSSSNSTNSPQ